MNRLAGTRGEATYTAPDSTSAAALRATDCQCSGVEGQDPSRSLGGPRGIFSHVREYPPWTSKRTRGVLPLDPAALAVCSSKSCGACRIGCGVRGFATGPCESIHVATAPYYREARMTVVRRRTACGGGFAALAAGGIAAFLFQQCSFL